MQIANKAKSFWTFEQQTNQKVEQTKNKEPKRNNGNIFGLFVFWKARTKQEQQKKERKKVKHGYTNNRQNMMCR